MNVINNQNIDDLNALKNGYITFNCPKNIIDQMIEDINLIDFDSDRPKNKLRKVIF